VAQEPIQRPPKIATPPPPDKATGSQTPTPQLAPYRDVRGLAEEEQTFLRFIIARQDTPVSEVYKALSLSWYKGNQFREHLSSQGYLAEIETRLGKGRRPMKFFLPTLQSFERLGVEPPTGRGGSIHRYIQHLVVQGAEAKGYRTQVECYLGNGGIVDVHLQNGEVRIAVEIAVVSKPQREIVHIRHCLGANYDHVFTIFLDEHLLARTQEALALTEEERGMVRLVPVSKLSGIG
jgi:hypothetical protein